MQGAVHPAELSPCCDRVVAAQLTSQATVFLAAYYNATRGSAQINAGLHPLGWTQFRSALADYDKLPLIPHGLNFRPATGMSALQGVFLVYHIFSCTNFCVYLVRSDYHTVLCIYPT